MLADEIQDLAHIDETRTIHVQGVDRRTPRRCETQYLRVISAPSKMGVPALLARVVQWHPRVIRGIGHFCAIIFVSVTSRTRKGKIVEGTAPTATDWQDMFDRKGTRCVIRPALTVFAAALCPFQHSTLRYNGDVDSRHRCYDEGLAA